VRMGTRRDRPGHRDRPRLPGAVATGSIGVDATVADVATEPVISRDEEARSVLSRREWTKIGSTGWPDETARSADTYSLLALALTQVQPVSFSAGRAGYGGELSSLAVTMTSSIGRREVARAGVRRESIQGPGLRPAPAHRTGPLAVSPLTA
jgi:hypothetical protein